MYQVKEGCPGCGNCINICPVEAIIPSPNMGMVIADKCIDCGICVSSCPVGLIEAVPTAQAETTPKASEQRQAKKEADVNA